MQWFPDHHAYTDRELDALAEWADSQRLDALVTTEKDAVKPAVARFGWRVPLLVLRVEMEMLGDGDKILGDLIDTMLKDHEEPAGEQAPS